jgi:hypothetical protein
MSTSRPTALRWAAISRTHGVAAVLMVIAGHRHCTFTALSRP